MVDTQTPSMIALAREAKGWSQRELAAATGVSQAVISKLESGAADLTEERITRLAAALDCPPALLRRPAVLVDNANTCLHHRRRHSKLSAAATRRIEGLAHLTRVTVEGIFDGVSARLETDISPSDIDRHTTPTAAAAPIGGEPGDAVPFDPRRADSAAGYLREQWKLDGPIENLVETIEQHGILVVRRDLGNRAQDGVSSWPADMTHPPIIVVNDDLPGDRMRFTLAHELAHLLLHRIPTEHAEREANRFAAEFLVPADAISTDLAGLTTRHLARLAALKDQWGVSIGMLIQRARDIEAISDRQFREFRLRLTRLGWDVNEPGTVPTETPMLLDKAIDLGRTDLGLSIDELASMAYMTPASFRRHYLPATSTKSTPRAVLNRTTIHPTGNAAGALAHPTNRPSRPAVISPEHLPTKQRRTT